nr:D-alanyl-D-alanine carboxypeptidase/D-alanyl-D-alanine-endopeptidase [Gammaproteobacteria bacterium]
RHRRRRLTIDIRSPRLSSLAAQMSQRVRALGVACMAALILTLPHHALAQSGALPEAVARLLEKHRIPTGSLSVYVRDVSANKPLVQVHAEVARNPASVMKVVTTLAGLDLLGPSYVWTTRAYARTAPNKGEIGDLFFVGGGDPFFVTERFWLFLRQLRDLGVANIRGDLVVDRSFFRTAKAQPGDFDKRPLRVYNVLPDASLINFHATRFILRPSPNGVAISIDPPIDNFVVDNQLRLRDGPCKRRGWKLKLSVVETTPRRVRIAGTYPKRCPKHELTRAVLTPAAYTKGLFTGLWRELGGKFSGQLRYGSAPRDGSLLFEQASQPLALQARGMNKFSNNVMTRHLLLTLGAEHAGPPGTLKKGRAAIEAWLRKEGVWASGFRIDNGAGLSRIARISARTLGELLWKAYRSPRMPEIVSSLPIAGVDGSMRYRLQGEAGAGRAHIKTGLLNGVRAMAGYVLTQTGRRLVVVSLHNHPGVDRGVGTQVQDALLRWAHNL